MMLTTVIIAITVIIVAITVITPVKIKRKINRPECSRPKKKSLVAGDRYNNTVLVLAQHEQALRLNILNKDGLYPSP